MRGPKHVVKKGKTPVLDGDEARKLLESIDTSTVVDLRDRALVALLIYTFARISERLTWIAESMRDLERYPIQSARAYMLRNFGPSDLSPENSSRFE